MRLLSLLSTVCLLASCNTRMRRLGESIYWVLFGVLTLATVMGLFALRRTIRALRQPGGHAIMDSFAALFVLCLPTFFLIPIIDAEPQWRANAIIAACALYTAFVGLCFVLSVVRWVRKRT